MNSHFSFSFWFSFYLSPIHPIAFTSYLLSKINMNVNSSFVSSLTLTPPVHCYIVSSRAGTVCFCFCLLLFLAMKSRNREMLLYFPFIRVPYTMYAIPAWSVEHLCAHRKHTYHTLYTCTRTNKESQIKARKR